MAVTKTSVWAVVALFSCWICCFTGLTNGQSIGCFGSAGACLNHNLTCPANTRVALTSAQYGHKTEERCTTGVIDCADTCCSYLPNSDCFSTFTGDHVNEAYRNCTKNECNFRTPRLINPCSRSSVAFQRISSYSVVQHECVDDSTIIPLCGGIASTYGTSVSALYDPSKQIKMVNDICWCSISHNSNTNVRVEAVDMRLQTSGGGCGSVFLYNSKANVVKHCNSPSVWPDMTIMESQDTYTVMQLYGFAEFLWVRFKASTPISVTCSNNAQHTTTTTTTQVPTTTTTTTTTVTYPTASLPPVVVATTTTPQQTTTTVNPQTTTSSSVPSVSTAEPTNLQSESSTPPYSTAGGTSQDSNDVTSGTSPTEMATSSSSTESNSGSGTTGQRKGGDNTLAAAVGGAAAGVIALLVIVILVVWCRSKHSDAKDQERQNVLYKDPANLSVTNPASNGIEKRQINNTETVPKPQATSPPTVSAITTYPAHETPSTATTQPNIISPVTPNPVKPASTVVDNTPTANPPIQGDIENGIVNPEIAIPQAVSTQPVNDIQTGQDNLTLETIDEKPKYHSTVIRIPSSETAQTPDDHESRSTYEEPAEAPATEPHIISQIPAEAPIEAYAISEAPTEAPTEPFASMQEPTEAPTEPYASTQAPTEAQEHTYETIQEREPSQTSAESPEEQISEGVSVDTKPKPVAYGMLRL